MGRHGETESRDRKAAERERQGNRQTQRDREGSISTGERETESEGHRGKEHRCLRQRTRGWDL